MPEDVDDAMVSLHLLLLTWRGGHGICDNDIYEVVRGCHLLQSVTCRSRGATATMTASPSPPEQWFPDHRCTPSLTRSSILHRLLEGGHGGGEVGHTGWDNNKYWTGGGPKLYYNDESSMQQQQKQHPVRAALAKVAWKQTQFARGGYRKS